MTSLADVFVSVRADTKPMRADLLKGSNAAAADAGKQAGSKFTSSFKSALKMGAAIAGAAAVAGGTKLLKDAVAGAGELQQSLGAIDTVFGQSAVEMHGWSKDAATAVGLTRNEFNELGTLIGSQLKNGGTAMDQLAPKTNNLIKLGADLSSMFGGSAKDAVGALSSALKGERDPIERYGVSLSQAKIDAEAAALGFKKVGTSLSQEASQAATLSLIMKQTKDAHGNFARESNTLAGQQQRLDAQLGNVTTSLGTMLLPALTKVTGKASTFITEMQNGTGTGGKFADVARGIARNLDTIGPALGVVVSGLAAYKIASLAAGAAAAIQAAGTTGATGATWSLNAALRANPIGLVVTALTALGTGLVIAWKKSDTFREICTGAFNAVGDAGRWLWNNALQPTFKFIVNGIGWILDGWAKMLDALGNVPGFEWADRAADKMFDAAEDAKGLANQINDIPPKKDVKVVVKGYYDVDTTARGFGATGFKGSGGGGNLSAIGGAVNTDVNALATDLASELRKTMQTTGGRVLPRGSYSIGMPYLGYPGHYGADYPAATGTPVFAAASGMVSRALSLAGSYGKHIFVNSGALQDRYAHLNEILVRAGDFVRAGQMIGRVGSTGNSTGPHLHFERRVNNSPINPATLGIFDRGGIMRGLGINLSGKPERVLSPRQTELHDRQTAALEALAGGGGSGVGRKVRFVVRDREFDAYIEEVADGTIDADRDFRDGIGRMGLN